MSVKGLNKNTECGENMHIISRLANFKFQHLGCGSYEGEAAPNVLHSFEYHSTHLRLKQKLRHGTVSKILATTLVNIQPKNLIFEH